MYLTHLLTTLREAVKITFDNEYPVEELRGLYTSLEVPIRAQDYPAIWVDWNAGPTLAIAGVAHQEVGDPADPDNEAPEDQRIFTRWRFDGQATFTVVALTSLERARIFDELAKVFAFGKETPGRADFRSYIENNEFIRINANFDTMNQSGFEATPGTPWGTADYIYEATLSLDIVGEVVSEGTGITATLAEIRLFPYTDQEEDPTTPGGWV